MALTSVGLTTHILNNQLRSALLLAGFPVLIAIITGGFFGALDLMMQAGMPGAAINWHQTANAVVTGAVRHWHIAVIVALIWFTIAWFSHTRLIRMATGARPITRTEMPRIYNLLENLCIAQGAPMPQFDIIDTPAMNAFASGLNEKTYRITLTRGIVERLSDDELEGVIAHELAHIMNRDVRLLVISVIFVGMISFFAEVSFRTLIHGGRVSAYSGGRGGKQGSNGLLILLAATIVLAIGYIFAILIRFALSRSREYMADAGAVEMTKNPDAMMRALLRISGNDQVKGMPEEVQQMCIENSHNFLGLFATHPPIQSRVRALSQTTGTPVPTLQVSLRRPPSRPWGEA